MEMTEWVALVGAVATVVGTLITALMFMRGMHATTRKQITESESRVTARVTEAEQRVTARVRETDHDSIERDNKLDGRIAEIAEQVTQSRERLGRVEAGLDMVGGHTAPSIRTETTPA